MKQNLVHHKNIQNMEEQSKVEQSKYIELKQVNILNPHKLKVKIFIYLFRQYNQCQRRK